MQNSELEKERLAGVPSTAFRLAKFMSCRIVESEGVAGYRAVRLENDKISLVVLPERGAEVHSLVHRRSGVDVLWKAPWGVRRQPGGDTETSWMDGYAGGWQEIFPNGGDPCTYQGALLGFHGEASVAQWDYSIEHATAQTVSAVFSVALARSPFRLRKTITVEAGRAAVRIEEVITNESEENLRYMWGHHPAYGAPFLSGDCRLVLPADRYQEHGTSDAEKWPGEIAISPEHARLSAMGYLSGLSEGWYELRNAKLGFGVRWSWPRDVFPHVWLWRELRGSSGYPWYGRCYVMGVEPFTSMPGSGLLAAIQHGTAPELAGGASVSAVLEVELIPV